MNWVSLFHSYSGYNRGYHHSGSAHWSHTPSGNPWPHHPPSDWHKSHEVTEPHSNCPLSTITYGPSLNWLNFLASECFLIYFWVFYHLYVLGFSLFLIQLGSESVKITLSSINYNNITIVAHLLPSEKFTSPDWICYIFGYFMYDIYFLVYLLFLALLGSQKVFIYPFPTLFIWETHFP